MTEHGQEQGRQGGKGQLWDVRGVLSWTVPFLKGKGVASARLDCELLLTKVLSCRRIDLYTEIDRPLSRVEQQTFGELLRRRVKGEPMAYILGQREFMGHSFQVSPAVLIPRPETELLVEAALAFLNSLPPADEAEPRRGLDVGTGSGCIAISLALAKANLAMTAWDVSPAALAVAAENARQLGVASPLQFLHRDALSEEAWQKQPAYDVIVSNPPYIAQAERAMLEQSVVAYEPEAALFAADEGLAFYQAMAYYARQALAPHGRLFWEIGYSQREAVCALLSAAGWHDITVKADYSGHDRIVSARP